MATKSKAPLSGHRKKKRRRSAPLAAAPRRTHHRPPARRRHRRMGDGGTGIMKHVGVSRNAVAALGGAGLRGVNMVVAHLEKGKEKRNPILAYAAAGAYIIGLSMMKMPGAASGAAGALGYELSGQLFKGKGALHDGMEALEDLEDHEFVPFDTLNDSGMEDEMGESVLQDNEGHLYALNDGGEYEHIGHMNDYADVQGASLQTLTPNRH